jgi:hypothetical protein
MSFRKVLLLSVLMMCFVGFAGSREAPARDVSDQCKADIRALFERCATECGRDFRCFLRCVVTNFPASCSL